MTTAIKPSDQVLSVAIAHAGSATIHAVRTKRIRDGIGAARDHQSDLSAICGVRIHAENVEPFLPWSAAVKVDHRAKCSKCRRATGLVIAFVLWLASWSMACAADKPVVTVYVSDPAVFVCQPCERAKRDLSAATDLPFDVKFSTRHPSWVTTVPVAVWRTDEPRQFAGWHGTRRLVEVWRRTFDEPGEPNQPRSSQWRTVRNAHIESHPNCIVCGRNADQVHHAIPFSRDPSKELDPDNLRSMCSKCHLVVGHLSHYGNWNRDIDTHADMLLRAKQKADRERMTPRTTP